MKERRSELVEVVGDTLKCLVIIQDSEIDKKAAEKNTAASEILSSKQPSS